MEHIMMHTMTTALQLEQVLMEELLEDTPRSLHMKDWTPSGRSPPAMATVIVDTPVLTTTTAPQTGVMEALIAAATAVVTRAVVRVLLAVFPPL